MESNKMTVSIIIPAYNEESLLPVTLDAIDKVRGLLPVPLEVIVADNNSKDKTGEVASAHTGVTVVKEINKGTNWARQAGLNKATGDIVVFLDADCVVDAQWCRSLVRHFESDPKLVGLSGPYRYYDLTWGQNAFYWMCCAIISGVSRAAGLFDKGEMAIGGNLAARRGALLAAGGLNTTLKFYGDDTDTAERLQQRGKMRFTLSFSVISSARRLLKEGFWTVTWKYLQNYIWITLYGRPHDEKNTDVRT